MKQDVKGPKQFHPDVWASFAALIAFVGDILLETALAGVLLFLVSGGGYASTKGGRQQVALGASLWLLAAFPVTVAVLWGCRETFRGRRRGMITLILLCVAALVSGVVMMSAVIGIAAGMILLFCIARLAGYGPRPI